MREVHAVLRMVVFAAFCAALAISVAAWLVRTRRVSPFSALSRALRALSEPVLHPIEHRLVRAGGNPTHAGWWLVIGIAAAGVLLLSLVDWVFSAMALVAGAAVGGPRALLQLAVLLAYDVLVIALVLRVVGSWLGAFRYSRWMRPAYALTDWLVEPIRRVLPPFANFDFSPLVAWLVLWVLRQFLLSIL